MSDETFEDGVALARKLIALAALPGACEHVALQRAGVLLCTVRTQNRRAEGMQAAESLTDAAADLDALFTAALLVFRNHCEAMNVPPLARAMLAESLIAEVTKTVHETLGGAAPVSKLN